MTDVSPKQSLMQRLLRRTITLTITGFVFVVAGGLIVGGSGLLAERADAVVAPDPAPMPTVRAMRLTPQTSHVVSRAFQGQVEPAQTVQLAFQQSGEIENLNVDEGDTVNAGDLIAQLETRILDAERTRLQASRRAIEAQVELAELTTGRQSALRERGFASQQQLDSARLGLADLEARIAEIDASMTRIEVQLSQTQLIAPFDGVVATRLADEGTVASVGQPVLELLQDSAPIFRVGVDPQLAGDVATLQDAVISINGVDYPASFVGFRPDLDRQTRTRTALFQIETSDPVYLDAGTLTLTPVINQPGYTVPLAALQDGVRGLWTVLSLTPEQGGDTHIVGLEAVEVLHIEGDIAYVDGTLRGEPLIVSAGVHRLVSGERVMIVQGAQ